MIAVVSRDEECPTQSVEISGRCCVDGRECASGLSLCLLTQAVSQLSTLSLSLPAPAHWPTALHSTLGPHPALAYFLWFHPSPLGCRDQQMKFKHRGHHRKYLKVLQ